MHDAIILGTLGFLVMVFEKLIMGTGMVSRPIVTGALTGILMGDIPTGVILGATLELVFLGNFSIGAALPPELISGTILATAFTIKSGQGIETALTIGLPIATLVLVIQNIIFIFGYPIVMRISDNYAKDGEPDKVAKTHIIAGFFTRALPLGLIIGISYYLGSTVIENVLNAIPLYIKDGLKVATGIMPALGFAILARMIINKKVAVFFLLGFILVSYMKLPFLAVALLGGIIATIIITNTINTQPVSDTDDDF